MSTDRRPGLPHSPPAPRRAFTPLRVGPFLAALAVLSACDPGPREHPDPVQRARSFLSAVRRGDCELAWTYFTRETQARIERESARYIAEQPYYAEAFAPKRLYCGSTMVNPYPSYVPESAELVGIEAEAAVVRVQMKVPENYALPGSFPRSYRTEPRELRLLRENGEWKISHALEDDG